MFSQIQDQIGDPKPFSNVFMEKLYQDSEVDTEIPFPNELLARYAFFADF